MGYVDFDVQALDHSRRCGGHFLFYCCCGPGDVDVQRTGHDAHHRQHASAERGCNQVRGRKAFAAPLIVLGGVGVEFGSRGAVDCFAVQVSLIFQLNGDHVAPLKRSWNGHTRECTKPINHRVRAHCGV